MKKCPNRSSRPPNAISTFFPHSETDSCLFQDFLQTFPAVVSIVTRDLIIKHINRVADDVSTDEIEGKNALEFIDPEFHDSARQTIEQVFETGIPSTFAFSAQDVNGNQLWFMCHLGPIHKDNKIDAVISINIDITAEKKAAAALGDANRSLEQQVEARTQELVAATDRFRTVADFTYDWETWEGPDGDMLYVSPSCERISGYSVQEFIADPGLLRKIIEPLDRPVWDEHITHRREKRIHDRGPIVEFRIRRKDGNLRWVQHQCQSVTDKNGEFMGIRGSNRDSTNYQKIKSEAAQRQAELTHVSRVLALGELTSSIAHELNQPLAAILCNAQAAQRFLTQSPPDLDEVGDAIEDIVSDERRADNVIKRLRKLLKKDMSVHRLLDVNKVIIETLAISANEAANANVFIEHNKAEDLPKIIGDRIQLSQVILNLLMNAIDALREGFNTPRQIIISCVHSDGFVDIRVSDNGPGLPSQTEKDIFLPFVSTKESGLGIGLSICKTIIEAHRGTLDATTRPEGGALFEIRLPISDGESE